MANRSLLRLAFITAAVGVFYYQFVTVNLRLFHHRRIDALPPENGDGVEYEHLAFNLSEGRGFSLFWSDPIWKAPFLRYQGHPLFDGVLGREGELSTTAYRPPLYPLVLSGVYTLLGRNFFFARLLNFLLFFAAVVVTAMIAKRMFGLVAMFVVLALALIDPSLPFWSYYFMTEPLATLLVALLMLVLLNAQAENSKHRVLWSGIGGALLALSALNRSIALLWFPMVLLLAVLPAQKNLRKGWIVRSICFASFFLIFMSPWIIRNIRTIHPSVPLGTQAGVNLAFDYSDAVIASEGLWTSAAWQSVGSQFENVSDHRNLSGVERELAFHRWGQSLAIDWSFRNAHLIPWIIWLKIRSLWYDHLQPYHLYLSFFGLISVFFVRSSPMLIIPLALLIANTAAVALTHNVPAGRFFVPVVPALYLLVSAAAAFLVLQIGKIWRRVRATSVGR